MFLCGPGHLLRVINFKERVGVCAYATILLHCVRELSVFGVSGITLSKHNLCLFGISFRLCRFRDRGCMYASVYVCVFVCVCVCVCVCMCVRVCVCVW